MSFLDRLKRMLLTLKKGVDGFAVGGIFLCTPVFADIGDCIDTCEKTLRCSVSQTADNLYYDIKSDLGAYLRKENLLVLGGVLLSAGIMANTGIDKSIHHFWQRGIRSKRSDRFFKVPCSLGDFHYPPIYYTSIILGGLFYDEECPESALSLLYTWGYRSIRTLYLAGAQKELFTWVVGNGRPNAHQSSKWHPFKNKPRKETKNQSGVGVSAHAFNGAIPFLSAAMMTDEPVLKYGLYAASVLPGLARINDDHHYFSQVFLGWSLSFLSALAIDYTERTRQCPVHFYVMPNHQGAKFYTCLEF